SRRYSDIFSRRSRQLYYRPEILLPPHLLDRDWSQCFLSVRACAQVTSTIRLSTLTPS
ncbi:unnamed protein product, partial [Arctogadus glacialis]